MTLELPPISKLGCGIWYMLHFRAARADTAKKAQAFIDDFYELAENFACPDPCGKHMQMYVDKNPFPKVKTGDNENLNAESLSRWMYNFHQWRTHEAKKIGPTYREVHDYYFPKSSTQAEECETVCLASELEEQERKQPINDILHFRPGKKTYFTSGNRKRRTVNGVVEWGEDSHDIFGFLHK